MNSHNETQPIKQLEKRKGGYYFLEIKAEVINQFKNKRRTRLICVLESKLEFRCGLNHLGNGNFFIILSRKNLEIIGKETGDIIEFQLNEDPNPLGADMPEVLEVLLNQDEQLNYRFEQLTPGKKRSIIHQMNRIKNLDKQISKAIELINNSDKRIKNRLN